MDFLGAGVLGLLCLSFSVVGAVCVGCLTVWVGLFVVFVCFGSSSVFCCVGGCVFVGCVLVVWMFGWWVLASWLVARWRFLVGFGVGWCVRWACGLVVGLFGFDSAFG